MKRLLYSIGGIILIAAAGAVLWHYLSPEQAARRTIEREGSAAVLAKVHAKIVRYAPEGGVGQLIGFAVENPSGFRAPNLLSADAVKFEMAASIPGRDVAEFRLVAVVAPRIVYEEGGSGSNFDVLLQGMRRARSAAPAEPRPRRLLIVDRLTISNARLSYAPAQGSPLAMDRLPEIQLSNIGRAKGGVTPEELALAVTEAILYQVRRALPAPTPGTTRN